jgi:hypothetical protein
MAGYEGKHCSDCGTGFAPEHRRCPICGSARIVSDVGRAARAAAASDSSLELLRAVPLAWARELAEALSRAGIAHRVEAARAAPAGSEDTVGGSAEYAIWISAADRERATRIDAEIFRRHVPGTATAPRDLDVPQPSMDIRGLAIRVVTLLIVSAILVLLSQFFGRR